jgi:hypothetical protein
MVMGNLPLTVFVLVQKGVAGLDSGTGSAHLELVNARILAPVGSNLDKGGQDGALGLELTELGKVVGDFLLGVAGDVWSDDRRRWQMLAECFEGMSICNIIIVIELSKQQACVQVYVPETVGNKTASLV